VAGKRPWKIGGQFSIEFSTPKLLEKIIHNLAGNLAKVLAILTYTGYFSIACSQPWICAASDS
jgi:hypothetical protein